MHCSNIIVVERQVYHRSVQSRISAIYVRNMHKESNIDNVSPSELCQLRSRPCTLSNGIAIERQLHDYKKIYTEVQECYYVRNLNEKATNHAAILNRGMRIKLFLR